MYSKINQQIQSAFQGMKQLEKIDKMLYKLQDEQEELENKVSKLKTTVEKEDKDVENLENKSIAKIFYSFLGNLDDRVEKERKEALSARLKYNQSIRDLSSVTRKISELNLERTKYINCKAQYHKLFKEKKELLIASNPKVAQKIMDITEQLSESKNNVKEIDEAIEAGENVIYSINRALSSLDSAEGWGVWDMLGGGLMTDLIKHSHIDDANSDVQQIQYLLRSFKSELTDIKISSDISVQTGGFTKFADFFFDGLISDWFMQSKIQNSKENISQVRRQVQNVINELITMKDKESMTLEKLEAEMKDMINQA